MLFAACSPAVSAFAAWNLLKPGEIAEQLNDKTPSAAFESENVVNINESVTSGDYIFTLLAIVSGKDITDHTTYSSDDIRADRTYAVVAIQRTDGAPMPSYDDDGFTPFYISPYVKGQKPWQVNAHTLGGGHAEIFADGVLYRMVEFDNITMFADCGVYLGIHEGSFPNNYVFISDEQTGELKANPEYEGVSALFNLPIDKSLADPEKAEQYIANLLNADEDDKSSMNHDTDTNDDNIFIDDNALSDIDWNDAVPVAASIKEISPWENGTFFYEWNSDEYGIVRTAITADDFDESIEPQSVINIKREGIIDGIIKWAVRFEKDENGVVKGMIVVPK